MPDQQTAEAKTHHRQARRRKVGRSQQPRPPMPAGSSDLFSRIAGLLAAGAERAPAWEVIRDYCSANCLLGSGSEEKNCECRCKEFGLGKLLHGYLRNHRVDCVPRKPRLQPAPDNQGAAIDIVDEYGRVGVLAAEALPEGVSA